MQVRVDQAVASVAGEVDGKTCAVSSHFVGTGRPSASLRSAATLRAAHRAASRGIPAGARTVARRAGSAPVSARPPTVVPQTAPVFSHTATAETIAGDRPSPDDLRTAAGLGDLARMHRWLDGGRPLPRGADAGMDFYGPTEWFPPLPSYWSLRLPFLLDMPTPRAVKQLPHSSPGRSKLLAACGSGPNSNGVTLPSGARKVMRGGPFLVMRHAIFNSSPARGGTRPGPSEPPQRRVTTGPGGSRCQYHRSRTLTVSRMTCRGEQWIPSRWTSPTLRCCHCPPSTPRASREASPATLDSATAASPPPEKCPEL